MIKKASSQLILKLEKALKHMQSFNSLQINHYQALLIENVPINQFSLTAS